MELQTLSHLLFAAAPSETWQALLEVLLLLGVAMVLGTLAERLKQSAIVGYLIAGTLIGPSVLGWVANRQHLFDIAELGVALLLFAIGLEFSLTDLRALGRVPLLAGPAQVVITLGVTAAISHLLGLDVRAALVVGCMVALSSTACVLRILNDRAEIDSPYGRVSLGILLVQDAAVVPLMLLVSILASGGTVVEMTWRLTLAVASAALLVALFYAIYSHLVPRILNFQPWKRNRDLPILLATVLAMGAAWVAYRLGLSPAMGAFVAGVLLAVSPFAVQIRADIEPLKTILVTLFFAAVGMFGDLPWLVQNAGLVLAVVLALVLGKSLLTALIVRSVGERTRFAVAGGLCLAQVGEFSFVLATIARGDGGEAGLLSETVFRAIVSATILSLLVTPYLITAAPHVGIWIERMLGGSRALAGGSTRSSDGDSDQATPETRVRDSIFILGFGPAGQRAAEDLLALHHERIVVVDINPENIAIARRYGLRAHIGDATQREVLEHARIRTARLVIITVPSPQTSRKLIHVVRYHAGGALLFVRARYHIHRWQLVRAGADVVVDEEDRVGHQLASEAAAALRDPANEAND